MPLKRFTSDTPEPTPTPTPSTSAFDPFKPVEDKRKSVLGERVYSEGETKMTPEEADALMQGLMRKAEEGFKEAEKVIGAYSRAAQRPSDANAAKFMSALDEILADPEKTKAVMTILIAVTSAHYRKGR